MHQFLLVISAMIVAIKAAAMVYDSSNYDNTVVPETLYECVDFYKNNFPNKYNNDMDYYRVVPELLPGYTTIKTDDIYIKPSEMYSGKVSIDEEKQHSLYFWKFNRPNDLLAKKDTLVLFINGGPGCSSMDGLLLENGPFRVDSDGKLVANKGSWHMHSDIVYLDQPLGTGFSTKLNSNEKNIEFYDADLDIDSSSNLIKFLIEYYKIFPQDSKKKLIIAGESYAGQYILHFTNNIWKFNKLVGSTVIDVDTVMLGNAWVDPIEQSSSYLPYFQQEGLFDSDNRLFKSLLSQQEECQKVINNIDISSLNAFGIGECESIMYSFISSPFPASQSKCLNVYDYRLQETAPSCGANWPTDLPYVAKFFRQEGVQEALHIVDLNDELENNDKNIPWTECSNRVSMYLKNELFAVPAIRFLPQLLEDGLNLYLFNGDKDIICNRLGVENYVKKLSWNGELFSGQARWHSWNHENQKVGQFLKDRGVTLINIFNGSHMVPYDKPMETRALFHVMDLLEADSNVEKVSVADTMYDVNTFNINPKRESIVYYGEDGKETEVFRETGSENGTSGDNNNDTTGDTNIDAGNETTGDTNSDNNNETTGDNNNETTGDTNNEITEGNNNDTTDGFNKQEHSILPSWILACLFIAVLVYIVKYILDTILLGSRALRESSTARLNGSPSTLSGAKGSRLGNDLEQGLGNSEHDIEMDASAPSNENLHDDIDLNND